MKPKARRMMRASGLAVCLVLVAMTSAVASGLWSPAELVGVDDDQDSFHPNVGVCADGTVVVVWTGVDPEQWDSELYYVSMKDGVQSQQVLVHEPNSGMDRISFMSVGSDGVPWIVWERYGDGYEQVVSHWDGAGWTAPETVFAQGGRYDWYNIHAASGDDVWVTKSSRAPGVNDRDIFLRHWDGLSWGGIERVGFEGLNDVTPASVTDLEGRAWVGWLVEQAVPGRDYVYAACRGDTGWGEPAKVDTLAGNLAFYDIDVCLDGRPIVVWWGNSYTGSPSWSDIEYATFNGDRWVYGGLVNQPDGLYDEDSSAAFSRGPDGDLWVCWKSHVYFAGYRGWITAARWSGDGWSQEEVVSVPDTTALFEDTGPEIAVASNGTVWSVWARRQESAPYDQDIYLSRREETTPVDFWGLAGLATDEAIMLSWGMSGRFLDVGFHVWRQTWQGGDLPSTGEVPPDAVRLTSAPVDGCIDCRFVDSRVERGSAYLYWLDATDGSATFGPVDVAFAGPSGVPTLGIVSVRPNPTSRGVLLEVQPVGRPGECVCVYSADGRELRRIPIAGIGLRDKTESPVLVHWDGNDSAGRPLPSGVYFVGLPDTSIGDPVRRQRVVILR